MTFMMMMAMKIGLVRKRGSHIRQTASDKVARSIFFTSNIKIDADDDGVMTLYFWVWEKVQVKEEGGR